MTRLIPQRAIFLSASLATAVAMAVACAPSAVRAQAGVAGSTGGASVPSVAAPPNPASSPIGAPSSARPGILTPPIASPGTEAMSGGRPAGRASAAPVLPDGKPYGNPRLEAAGRKLDQQIKRGICVGC